MHKAEHLNFSKLSLAAPRPTAFDNKDEDVEMRFCAVRYPTRQLMLYLHGTVAEAPSQSSLEYGGMWSFYFKPTASDLEALEKLENLLVGEEGARVCKEIGYEDVLSHYEQRETLNENFYLRIKLKRDDEGWKFTCSSDMTLDTVEQDLKKGTKVTLTIAPGFYFNESDNKYGMFLTLKELKFDEQYEAPKLPSLKKVAQGRIQKAIRAK
jgi:hypothetical protein